MRPDWSNGGQNGELMASSEKTWQQSWAEVDFANKARQMLTTGNGMESIASVVENL